MNLRLKLKLLTFILLSIPVPAIAAEKENLNSIVLSGGRSMAQNGCESPWAKVGTHTSECSDSAPMYRVAYNYKFTPTWHLEISGGDLGRPNVDGTYLGGPSTWEMKIDGWTIAAIGNIAIGNSFSLFGKVGAVRAHFREHFGVITGGVAYYGSTYNGVPTIDEDRTGLTYGAGFQIDFNKSVGLRFQYENFGKYEMYSVYKITPPESISISTASAGLVLSF